MLKHGHTHLYNACVYIDYIYYALHLKTDSYIEEPVSLLRPLSVYTLFVRILVSLYYYF
jgi:hypothetical protein